jgi:MFS family permease
MLGTLMGSLDSTIVLLAFPVINDSFHSDLVTSLWIIASIAILAIAGVLSYIRGRDIRKQAPAKS